MDDSLKSGSTVNARKPVVRDELPVACLSYEDLSARTGLSLSTLRRRVKDGSIPFIQPGGSRTRIVFPVDVLGRLLQSAAPATPPTPEPTQPKPRQFGPRPAWLRGSQS